MWYLAGRGPADEELRRRVFQRRELRGPDGVAEGGPAHGARAKVRQLGHAQAGAAQWHGEDVLAEAHLQQHLRRDNEIGAG